MDKQTLYVSVGFLVFAVVLLGYGWVKGQWDVALKLSFISVLGFIAVLAVLTQKQAKDRVEAWKKDLEEEVLLESQATYYEGGAPETVDAEKALGTETHGTLYATANYLVYKGDYPPKEFSIERKDIVSVFRGALVEGGKLSKQGFHGLIVFRVRKQYHKFVVDDVERWLRLFEEQRFGGKVTVSLQKQD